MVRYYDDFYIQHYTPLLMHPNFNISDLPRLPKSEEDVYEDIVEMFGDAIEPDRLEIPDEFFVKELIYRLDEIDLERFMLSILENDLIGPRVARMAGLEDHVEKFIDEQEIPDDALDRLVDAFEEVAFEHPHDVKMAVYDFDDELYCSIEHELEEAALIFNYSWEPEIWDVNTALTVPGIIAFKIEGLELIGITAVGTDMSPALEAYQALTHHTVPSNSTLLRSPEYSKYIIGEELYNEVIRIISSDE